MARICAVSKGDRKSGVEGKRGDLGGGRLIKKKRRHTIYISVTGVQTCALPIWRRSLDGRARGGARLRGRWRESAPCRREIGRAAWRERGEISVGAGSLKKKDGIRYISV